MLETTYDVHTTISKENCFDLLEAHQFTAIISDYRMPDITGIELLKRVREEYPHVRRILLSGHLDMNVIIESVNKAEIHTVIQKPFKYAQLLSKIEEQVEEYEKTISKEQELSQLKTKYHELSEQMYSGSDELLDLIIDLSDYRKISDFAQQFIKAIEGILSLIRLNSEVYFSEKGSKSYHNIINYLSDIEIMARQYDQKIVTLYIQLLRAYITLYAEDFEDTVKSYSGVESIHHWLEDELVPGRLQSRLELFPLYDNIDQFKRNPVKFYDKQVDKVDLKDGILDLLNIELGTIINISSKLLSYVENGGSKIQYLVIVAEDLPVYDYQNEEDSYDLALISGFFVALSQFLQEMSSGKGDIEKIKHDGGVILIHAINNVKYLLMTSSDEVHFRIGLRQFAQKVHDMVMTNPKSNVITDELEAEITDELLNIFEP